MINISNLKQHEIIKGYKAKFIHTENNTLAFWNIEKGAVMPVHAHKHEQSTLVMEGEFQLYIGEKSEICKEGFVVVIPPDVAHGGVALTDCKLFDIFSPVREDYKKL